MVAFAVTVWLYGPVVALLTADRWAALGLRLSFGLFVAVPLVAMTAPGVVCGHSIPAYVSVVVRSLATPRLAVYRSVPPAVPALPAVASKAAGDDWGTGREEWA